MCIKRLITFIVCLLFVCLAFAHNHKFHALGKAEGLSDMFVLHITQMKDGGIAVTSWNYVDIINGKTIKSYSKDSSTAMVLNGYKGAYHAYVDKSGRLWVKNYKSVWCYDKDMKPQNGCIPDSCDDLFVDEQGEVFFVKQQDNAILDLVTMKGLKYEFRNNGVMTCMDGEHKIYDIALPLDSTAKTSLVVCDTMHERLYQLIDSRLCIEYDVKSRNWTEIFRSDHLHTISLVDNKTAYIVSNNGLWLIDLKSRKVEMVGQVQMDDGSYISSSRINSVFADRDGNIWFGTYDHGVLKSCDDESYAAYWMGVASVLLVSGGIGWSLRKRYKKKISEQKSNSGEQDESIVDNEITSNSYVDNEFVDRVRLTIEQNIATPNYTVERLAQDLCMERTGLYKKLVAMTGMTPTAFVRKIKVEYAENLIRSGKYTITQVAELTGFSSSSYMAKCFQEEKGIKPSEIKDFNDTTLLNQQ